MRLHSLLSAGWLLVSLLTIQPASTLPQSSTPTDYTDPAEPQPPQLQPYDIDGSSSGSSSSSVSSVSRPYPLRGALLTLGAGIATLAVTNAGLAMWVVKENGKRVREFRRLRDDLAKQITAAEISEGLLRHKADAHGKELGDVRQQLSALHQRLADMERKLELALVRETKVMAATGAQKTVEGIGGPIEFEPKVLECVADKLEKFFLSVALHEDGVHIAHRALNMLIAECGRQLNAHYTNIAKWQLPEPPGAKKKVKVVIKKLNDAAPDTSNGGPQHPNSNTSYQRDDAGPPLLAGLSAENVRRYFAQAHRASEAGEPLGSSRVGVGWRRSGSGVGGLMLGRMGVR